MIMNIPHMRCPEKSGHIDPDFFGLDVEDYYKIKDLQNKPKTIRSITDHIRKQLTGGQK